MSGFSGAQSPPHPGMLKVMTQLMKLRVIVLLQIKDQQNLLLLQRMMLQQKVRKVLVYNLNTPVAQLLLEQLELLLEKLKKVLK